MICNNSTPLTGIVLVGYAQAYANAGVATAAHRCGYGENVRWFGNALRSTCADIGIESQELSSLMAEHRQLVEQGEPQPQLVIG